MEVSEGGFVLSGSIEVGEFVASAKVALIIGDWNGFTDFTLKSWYIRAIPSDYDAVLSAFGSEVYERFDSASG